MQATLLLSNLPHVAAASTLAAWRSRGDRVADAKAGREAALRECFEFPGQSLPVAALTRSLDAGDAGRALWLRADPAWVMADAVTLRLMQCGKMDLSTSEVEQFAVALKPLIGDEGFLLEAEHPERWYLRCSREARLPKFSSPQDALGDSLASHLPEGEEARRWRNLLNEVQIVLTQHPVNILRARRGLPPVNSLWFWGPGVLPAWARSRFSCVCSDDQIPTALALLAKAKVLPQRHGIDFQRDIAFQPDEKKALLIDLADQRDASALESLWLVQLDAALKRKQIAQVDLHFESGERYVVKPAHRWRFWRRAKTSA